MTREDIQLALRLVAMGRVNHPQVEQLVEALEGVFARKCDALPVVEVREVPELVTIDEEVAEVRRARRKKAD